jgi:hypothetical protein
VQYGPVVMLLGWSDMRPPINMDSIRDKLIHGLARFTSDDYLVPCGHPTAIAIAAIVASEHTDGHVCMLVWDGKYRKYDMLTIDLDWQKITDAA